MSSSPCSTRSQFPILGPLSYINSFLRSLSTPCCWRRPAPSTASRSRIKPFSTISIGRESRHALIPSDMVLNVSKYGEGGPRRCSVGSVRRDVPGQSDQPCDEQPWRLSHTRQALFLLAVKAHRICEHSKSFQFMGLACRLMQALGFHRDRPLDRGVELHRRIYWCTFV